MREAVQRDNLRHGLLRKRRFVIVPVSIANQPLAWLVQLANTTMYGNPEWPAWALCAHAGIISLYKACSRCHALFEAISDQQGHFRFCVSGD